MEFIRDNVDYSVPDFFEKFSNSLPKIVVVNQGFYGDIVQDTFDRDQVLRIHTFSRQKRVIARKSSEGKSHSEYFSIPLSYPIPLCVVKHIGKPSREKSLEEIVNGRRLPVNVQFSKERSLAVGSRSISGGQFPQLQLTEVFEEIYMLGNFIIEGVVHLKPEIIPLYLMEMRLVEVIGLKDHDQSKWRNYFEEITDKVNNSVTFDTTYGNKDIAIYNPDVIKPDTIYSHTAPRMYTNLFAMIRHKVSSSDDGMSDSSTYETLGSSQTGQSHVHEEDTNVYDDISDPPKSPKKSMKTPPVKPESLNVGKARVTSTDVPSGKVQPTKQGHGTAEKYEQIEITKTADRTEERVQTEMVPVSHRSLSIGSSLAEGQPLDISSLKISQLCEWMAALKLSKYIPMFKDEMIDGEMLMNLDENTLQEEFGMKKLESIRLMIFVRKGHVPS